MNHEGLFPAASLIPQQGRMGLIDWVKGSMQNGVQAETTVTERWPLYRNGSVSSLICIELVAQSICALSTWRRGKGARPRVGLLVGIKEAEIFTPEIPVGTTLDIRVQSLYLIGEYAVFSGEVRAGSALYCKTVLQVLEPEEDILRKIKQDRNMELTDET